MLTRGAVSRMLPRIDIIHIPNSVHIETVNAREKRMIKKTDKAKKLRINEKQH